MAAGRALAILLLLPLAALAAGTASAQGPQLPAPCTVQVTVNDDAVSVHINSTNPGTASTSGTVVVDYPSSLERAVVSIQASVDAGWPLSISPQTITISGNVGRNQTFYLTVVVPPGQPVTTSVVHVTARMTVGGMQCTSPTVDKPTITVLPYIDDLAVVAPSGTVSTSGPGQGRTVELPLHAKANANLDVAIAYTAPDGIIVDGPTRLTGVRRDDGTVNTTFAVKVRPNGEMTGLFPVTVEVHATAAGSEPSVARVTFGFEVQQASLPGPGAAAVPLAFMAAALAAALAGGRRRGGPR